MAVTEGADAHVVATAGHVDHGKSTLVTALTGMAPDRLPEERRRGLTIDLGFAWTRLPSGRTVAFVDVPGHERFVPNMLAGIGPVPAVLFVVAADEGWMPQSAEHLAALDAFGVSHGLLAVTRTDLADPATALAQARCELRKTSLRDIEAVTVSPPSGAGMVELRAALDRLVGRLPAPARDAPVRLWVDRSFTIRGAGTVVTGTLSAGTLRAGDELEHTGTGRRVHIRRLHSLGVATASVSAVARVGVNLRRTARDQVRRGDALVTPHRFHLTDVVDVRLVGSPVTSLPRHLTLHLGSAALTVVVRPLGVDTARLRLPRRLPLHVGDRALLRDPGNHDIAGAVTVLDVAPPPLRGSGTARRRAAELTTMSGRPDEADELRRRKLVEREVLTRMGVTVTSTPVIGDWLADPDWWSQQRQRLHEQVERHLGEHPLAAAAPVEALRQSMNLPDRRLVEALVTPPLVLVDGRIGPATPALPESVRRRVDALLTGLAARPFRAPEARQLVALGLGPPERAAAARAGAIVEIAPGVVLAPDAPTRAARMLGQLPQPFTVSQACRALDTSRRVAIPLLELLDRTGAASRQPDGTRVMAGTPADPRA